MVESKISQLPSLASEKAQDSCFYLFVWLGMPIIKAINKPPFQKTSTQLTQFYFHLKYNTYILKLFEANIKLRLNYRLLALPVF